MSPKRIAVAALAVGVVATGGAATELAAPAGAAATPVLSAFSVPLDNDHGRANDLGRGNDHGRDGDHGRDNDNDHGRGWAPAPLRGRTVRRLPRPLTTR
jgi:hypothetical protein